MVEESADEALPHVVIIGGGFGGLNAAQELGSKPARVTLIDRRNHHLFQPLLYQVATATLSPGEIAEPLRLIVRRHRNVRVLLADVVDIQVDKRQVQLDDGDLLHYDYLILAAGASHAYFGHDDWEAIAPGLKTLEDAVEIRSRILTAFEHAERLALEARDDGKELDPKELKSLLTFAIVGGGPTGVELAGALSEIARHTLAGEFQGIDPGSCRIVVLEAGPRILPGMPAVLSAKAEKALKRLGVEVRTKSAVSDLSIEGASVGDTFYPARTVFWAAGVAASPLAKTLKVPLDKAGRVPVGPDLTVADHSEISVIGDLAAVTTKGDTTLPGLAAVAMQEGRAAALNVLRTMNGEPRARFRYRDRGTMAIVGRGSAVAALQRARLDGPVAWIAWLCIHLYMLIGFDNRLLVLLEWAWSYLTWNRGARLITEPRAPTRSPRARRSRGHPDAAGEAEDRSA